MGVKVVPVPGTNETAKRGLAYLEWAGGASVNAGQTIAEFCELEDSSEANNLWARFDYWIDGGKPHDRYFHRWTEKGYEHCFVFKWKKGRTMQRFYGVLFHPKPEANPGFEVCVLFSHVPKFGKHTDPAQKDRAEALFADKAVRAAVKKSYPDE